MQEDVTKLRLIDVLIYGLYAASIYGAYIFHGTFIYDDWSVAALGLSTDSVWAAVSRYFENFTNRPLAPVYYGLISRFGVNPSGYIFVTCALWCVAVLIIGSVISMLLGGYVATIFIYLASIPLISSTLIFSPGMQSLGAFSLFLWALSFAILYIGVSKKKFTPVYVSLALVLSMVLSYEVCFPLLALTLFMPLTVKGFKWRDEICKKLFSINFYGVVLIVFFALAYQKILAPYFFGDIGNISRLRITNLDNFFLIYKLTYELLSYEYPNLLLRGFLITANQAFTISLMAPLLLGCIGLYLSFRNYRPSNSNKFKKYLIITIATLFGVIGVGLIHWGAAVGPTAYGYSNRGLGSLAILLPLLIALLLGYFLNRSRLMNFLVLLATVAIFFLQLACFMLVRENFLEIARLQNLIIHDVDQSISKVDQGVGPRIVLADIPEVLLNNFNGESVYSDEVHDWAMSLNVFFPGKYSNSATLTMKKVCANPRRVYFENGNLVLVQPDIIIPLHQVYFYRYDLKSKQSLLLNIRNAKEMHELLERQFDCGKKLKK